MARRKQNRVEDLIELTSKLPWWVGVVLAIAAYFWLHHVATTEVTGVVRPGQMGELVTQNLFNALATVGQYLLPFAFLVVAASSAYGRYKRRALHEQVAAGPGRGELNHLSWRQFEALVGEAFRRKGYSVTETADGGVDLVLKKEGETFLVLCKQWRATQLGMNIVRELYGVMTARSATGGFVVTSGVFTDEACAFARGKNIELMDGKALHALVRGVSVPVKFFRDPLSIMTTGAPFCPECQSRMVMRKARHGANAVKKFWRCSRHPDCKGKRPA
ncbi:MAG TPA: restriction endonuclease [Thiobacillus sp.]|nr:restriction endonuclease [Thiobacillus sp.]